MKGGRQRLSCLARNGGDPGPVALAQGGDPGRGRKSRRPLRG
jgi:hypothetical protein